MTQGGVHRVQRVPVTERMGRLHTSTVSVAVMPEPTEIDIQVMSHCCILYTMLLVESKRNQNGNGAIDRSWWDESRP